ncbi:MAG: 4Fe-4S dicluster domain-containing protein [Candidatus Bathyarchaeia archaeon]
MILKLLVVNPEKCTGCRICELVCSLHHTNVFNIKRSRISILKYEEGLDIPMLCQHCETPLCKEACITGAIYRDEKTNAIMINENKCIGCKICMLVCPFGGISIDIKTNKIIKCDLCNGDPQCVEFCPTNALEYVRADKFGILKKKAGVEKRSKYISHILEKRTL